jgi:hypothetical protein
MSMMNETLLFTSEDQGALLPGRSDSGLLSDLLPSILVLMFLLGIAEGRSIPSVASQRFGVANK